MVAGSGHGDICMLGVPVGALCQLDVSEERVAVIWCCAELSAAAVLQEKWCGAGETCMLDATLVPSVHPSCGQAALCCGDPLCRANAGRAHKVNFTTTVSQQGRMCRCMHLEQSVCADLHQTYVGEVHSKDGSPTPRELRHDSPFSSQPTYRELTWDGHIAYACLQKVPAGERRQIWTHVVRGCNCNSKVFFLHAQVFFIVTEELIVSATVAHFNFCLVLICKIVETWVLGDDSAGTRYIDLGSNRGFEKPNHHLAFLSPSFSST